MGLHRHATGRTVAGAETSIEHPQEVRNLRQGSQGGTGTRHLEPLTDGNGRAQALDGIDFRRIQALQKLTRPCRQRFQIPPLAFGEECVESEGGFSGPAYAGNHDELVAGKGNIDVLEIVLASAANDDMVHIDPARALTFIRSGMAHACR